jgi:hypothetical protein
LRNFSNSGLCIDEYYKDLYNELIPSIGIGVGGYDYNTTYDAVLKALKIGYRLIDTAENYFNEDVVGNVIIDSKIDRNKIIIISKYFGGINYGNPNDVINSFNNSLKKLKTNYIDIYLIHTPFGCKWINEWEPINNDKFIKKLEKYGYFSDYRAFEDFFFASNLKKQGGKILKVSGFTITHHNRTTFNQIWKNINMLGLLSAKVRRENNLPPKLIFRFPALAFLLTFYRYFSGLKNTLHNKYFFSYILLSPLLIILFLGWSTGFYEGSKEEGKI